jgi:hypothetical protein
MLVGIARSFQLCTLVPAAIQGFTHKVSDLGKGESVPNDKGWHKLHASVRAKTLKLLIEKILMAERGSRSRTKKRETE